MRGASGGEGELVGGTGLHRIDWSAAQVRDRLLAEDRLRGTRLRHRGGAGAGAARLRRARRAPARDPHGRRQRARAGRVAERAGFTLEALLRLDSVDAGGRAAQHARLCARARRRGADGPERLSAARRRLSRRRCAGREAVDRVGDDAVDAERVEPPRLGRIVDGVDAARACRRA